MPAAFDWLRQHLVYGGGKRQGGGLVKRLQARCLVQFAGRALHTLLDVSLPAPAHTRPQGVPLLRGALH